jgi:hypothetical protein
MIQRPSTSILRLCDFALGGMMRPLTGSLGVSDA